MRIFLAAAKGTPDSQLEEPEAKLRETFSRAGFDPKIVRSRVEWESSFSQCGSWDAWTTHVAQGISYQKRTPLYDVIVCLDTAVGKATAQICQKALATYKNVLVYQEGALFRVCRVEEADSDNWQSGWRLVI